MSKFILTRFFGTRVKVVYACAFDKILSTSSKSCIMFVSNQCNILGRHNNILLVEMLDCFAIGMIGGVCAAQGASISVT